MPVLATVTYPSGPQCNFPRSYTNFFSLSWVSDYYLVTDGNPFVFHTPSFGGVNVHLKFKDEFYAWSSNIYSLDWILEDYWAEVAPTYAPVNAGTIHFATGVHALTGVWGFNIGQPLEQKFLYFPLPPAPPDYWLQLPPP